MVGRRIHVYKAKGAHSGINKLPNIDFKTLMKMMNVLSRDGLSDCAETFIHATDNFFFISIDNCFPISYHTHTHTHVYFCELLGHSIGIMVFIL